MKKTLLNRYAVRNGKVICIDDLSRTFERGRNARCSCPGCGKDLSARFPEDKKAHFAHTGKACEENRYLLNLLYYILKDAIEEKEVFFTPGIYGTYKYLPPKVELIRSNVEKNVKFYAEEKENTKELIDSKWNHCGNCRFYSSKPGAIDALIVDWKNYKYNFAVVFASANQIPRNIPSQNVLVIDVDTLKFDNMVLDNIKYLLRSDKINKKWVKHYKMDKFIDESLLRQERWTKA